MFLNLNLISFVTPLIDLKDFASLWIGYDQGAKRYQADAQA